jgi:hypothetical protein
MPLTKNCLALIVGDNPTGAFPNSLTPRPATGNGDEEIHIMPYTAAQLLSMSQQQLDDLFSSSPAGDIPNGEANGTAIIASGTTFSPEIAGVINIFTWKGKTFDAAHGTLTNRILAFGLNAIVAQVYKAASLFDGKECIVLDYSKTSLVAEHVRDEIRQIGPGMYLGLVYWNNKKTIDFALQFPGS